MYKFLTKNGQTVAFVVGAGISAIFLVLAMTGIKSAGFAGQDLTAMKDKFAEMNFFNFGLYAGLALITICILLLAVFMVVDIVKFPKQTVKSLLAFVALIAVFLVIYSTSQAETGPLWSRFENEFGITPTKSRLISAGLWTTIGILALSVIVMVVSEVRNFFK